MASPDNLDSRLLERRQETLGHLPQEAVAWLVLLPVWTNELAETAGFPAPDLKTLLDECEALGWCVRQQAVHGLGGREAAELLTDLAVRLRTDAPGDPVAVRIGAAAQAAIAGLKSASRRSRIAARLAGPPTGTGGPAPEPGAGDPTDAVVGDIASGPDIGTAARAVAAAALHMAPSIVLGYVSALMDRWRAEPDESPVAALYLAGAAVTAGDIGLGMSISEEIPDPRVRVNALAEVAVRIADTGDRTAASEVVLQVAARLGTQEQVDLNCAAEAAERVSTGRVGLDLGPILRKVTGFPEKLLGPQHIESLSRLATAVRSAGLDRIADPLVERALAVAERQEDPAAQAAALVRLLPAVAGAQRRDLALHAWQATQEMADPAQRAQMLAALLPDLAATSSGPDAADELIGLCGSSGTETTYSFWTPDSSRADLIEALAGLHDADWLRSIAARLGEAVYAAPAGHPVPAAAQRWACLARLLADDATGERAGDKLLANVDRALASGASAEAGGWVLAGRRLSAVVQGTFETCLLLGVRRVELVNRRTSDRRLLGSFLAREEQLAAFERLLADDGGWALHYLGYGGVGKTMLLRHLCARAAPARGWIPARIDFDHLNPEFPWQRPGQLLLELLEELEAHAPNDASRRYFHQARDHLRQLQWWRGPEAPQQRIMARAGLERAVGKFCEYLKSLGQPVLIVLDTCEELAKFQPVEAELPQLNAAFDLLEAVHAHVPGMRVVLSGRRPLALAGAGGWQVNRPRVQAHLPADKDYLAVHVVRGFSREEATTYLSTVEKVVTDPRIVETVLERSIEEPRTPYLEGPVQDDVRYSPFDLALYAGLLRTDPEAVRSDDAATAYLNARLIDRLGPAAPVLPAVLAMRRFDYDMLTAAVPPNLRLDEVWPQFAGAEWVVSRLDATLPDTFLEVDAGMLPRLTAFYHKGQPAVAYRQAVRLLGPRLAALVRDRRPDQLDIAHVEAALRCLPPADGAELSDSLAFAVARDGSWMWAFTVCGRLLDTEGVLAEPQHPARPSTLALYASAAAHLNCGLDLAAVWADVAASAERHPEPEVARWLRMRAQVMSPQVSDDILTEAIKLACRLLGADDEDRQARGSWLLGTVLVAAERRMDRLDEPLSSPPDDGGLRAFAAAMDHVAAQLDDCADGPGDRYVLAGLLSRLHWFVGNRDAARTTMESALAGLAAGQVTSSPYLAADRPGPINWRSRVRLRATALDLAQPEPDWLFAALTDDIAQIDSDRLASTVLRRRLDREPVPAPVLEEIEDALGQQRPPVATARLHHSAPPLRVTLARGWLALGRAHRARSVLGPVGSFAESADDQAELDAMRIEIARRMRLSDADRHLRKSLVRSAADGLAGRAARVLEAAALLDTDPRYLPSGRDRGQVHLWWRGRAGLPSPGPERDAVRSAGRLRARDLPSLALALDAVELAILMDEDPRRRLDELRSAIPDHIEDETQLRLALRFLALAGSGRAGHEEHLPAPDALRQQLGVRRIAEVALEEGELLALRLPAAARPLLADAARWFLDAGDPAGRLIATTACLLAAAHAGDEPAATELPRLAEAYAAVAERNRLMPTWKKLPLSASTRSAEIGPAPDDPDWQGWLLRLRWLLAGPGGGLRSAVAHGQKAVPAELRPVARAATPALARMSDVAYETMSAISGSVAGTSDDVPAGWRRFLRPASRLAALLAGMAAAGGSRRNHVTVDVEPGENESGENDSTVLLTVIGHRHRRWPLPTVRNHATATIPAPADPPYPPVPEVIEVVRTTADRRHLLPVALRVPADLTRLDWEATVLGQLPEGRIQPWRLFDSLPVADTSEVPGRRLLGSSRGPAVRSVRWAGPPQWAALVHSASGATPAHLRSLAELRHGETAVLIASAVDAKGKPLLAIRLAGDRQLLLQPDDLLARGVLLVVCGEPGWEGRHDAADRLGTGDLRECCADLMDAGAEAVVVVPSLPELGLREALRLLVPAAGGGRGLLERVCDVRGGLQGADRDAGANITVMLREW